MLRLFTAISKFSDFISYACVFNTHSWSFLLRSVSAVVTLKSGNNALFYNRDDISRNFKDYMNSISELCGKPMKDVLEVMMKFYSLTEVYLEADVSRQNNKIQKYIIARESTNMLRLHTMKQFSEFKKDVRHASFLPGNYIQIRIHSLDDFLDDNSRMSNIVGIGRFSATGKIQFPEYAAIGVNPDNESHKAKFEFVVPYAIGDTGVTIIVINVSSAAQMAEALSLLYTDLTSGEIESIKQQLNILSSGKSRA